MASGSIGTLASGWLVFVLACGCGASAGPSSALSLRRIVLYQNGLGYFERSGRYAEQRLPLRFAVHEVDDALSTLTVLDAAGGQTVVSASVPQRRADESDDDVVELELRLADRRERDLTLSYALPTPAWRAAYRIVLPEHRGQGEALLQVWALVHNASPEDWREVRLALATAAPISYRVDLRTPALVERPDVSSLLLAPTVRGAVVGERSRAEALDDSNRDADRDGIPDASDACPQESETYDGADDEDGCPDRGRLLVTESHVAILDSIHFERGSAAISEDSRPILDAIAATLGGNPQIVRVEVQGHASDDEADPFALSSERASAVRRALIERGVSPARLVIRPFGATQPLEASASAAARARNRRVGFRIVERAEAESDAADHAGERSPAASPAAVTVEGLARSTASASRALAEQGTTRYDVAGPVTIPARSSALVAILTERVRGEAILLYAPDPAAPGSDAHPFRAARIATPEATTLIPGPATVYAGGNFAGQGLVEALHEGEVLTLPYAIDGSTRVDVREEGDREPSRLVAIARGIATVEDRSIRRTRYAIRPGERTAARIFVRHRRTAGTTPRNLPPGTEETETALLVPLPLEDGTPAELVIEETTPTHRTVSIVSDLRTPLMPYLEVTGAMQAEVAAALRDAFERRARLAELEERIDALRERIEDQSRWTAELRENLRVLGSRPSPTRTGLEQRLREASGAIERLSRELADAQAAAAEQRAALSEAILALVWEAPPGASGAPSGAERDATDRARP